jgi:hypothetical protein
MLPHALPLLCWAAHALFEQSTWHVIRPARWIAPKGQGQADHRWGGARLNTTTSKIQKIIAKNANKNNGIKIFS